MRVLLVYSNQCKDLVLAPPIGLSYIATATKKAGHKVEFLDLLVAGNPQEILRKTISEFEPDVVGVSVRNIDNIVAQRVENHLPELAEFLMLIHESTDKVSGKKIYIVLGGPAISILEEMSLRHLDADFAICGEGEKSFPDLLDALENETSYYKIPGLCYRRGDVIFKNPKQILEGFGRSYMEDWIDWSSYRRLGNACWAIQTKRGCPLKCDYCSYPAIEGRRFRKRSAEDVVDEIEEVIARVGPQTFEIVDSTFNAPQSHAIRLCQEIIRRKIKANFTAMGVNPIATSPELFSSMKRAGFNSMMVTPESASDTMLASYKKDFEMPKVYDAVRYIRESGIHSTWFFMLGGPGETQDTVNETMRFVETELAGNNMMSIFIVGIRIFSGTGVASTAYREGFLKSDTDLSRPTFYISPQVTEDWMIQRINQAIQKTPYVVLAASEGQTFVEFAMQRTLRLVGAAPPYWRFLPAMLGNPIVHSLRKFQQKTQPYRAAGGAAPSVSQRGS